MDRYTALTHAIEIAKSAVSGIGINAAYAGEIVDFIKAVAAGLEGIDSASGEAEAAETVPETPDYAQDEEAKALTQWPNIYGN